MLLHSCPILSSKHQFTRNYGPFQICGVVEYSDHRENYVSSQSIIGLGQTVTVDRVRVFPRAVPSRWERQQRTAARSVVGLTETMSPFTVIARTSPPLHRNPHPRTQETVRYHQHLVITNNTLSIILFYGIFIFIKQT